MQAVASAPESRDVSSDGCDALLGEGAADRSDYDSQAREYSASVESDWRRVVEENNVMRLLGHVGGCVVIDVGCGTGRLACAARDRGARLVHALDPSAGMLDVARNFEHFSGAAAIARRAGDGGHCEIENDGSTGAAETGEIRYVQCCAEELCGDNGDDTSQTTGVAAATADAVVMSLVLHHLDSPKRVLRALRGAYSALRSGGCLVGANSCPPPDMAADASFEFPRAECHMPSGNVEWGELHALIDVPPASVVRLTLFVQRWPTLRALIEEAGFRCVERHEPRLERAFVESLSPAAAASLERYLLGLALFTAVK